MRHDQRIRERFMTTRKTLMLAALISLAPAGMVMAQSQTAPSTQPSSASSPSMATPANEAPADSDRNSDPSSSSTQQPTHMASKQAMKDCVAKQKQDNQGITSADARKACKQQMKGSG
jgi:hypothetical protein